MIRIWPRSASGRRSSELAGSIRRRNNVSASASSPRLVVRLPWGKKTASPRRSSTSVFRSVPTCGPGSRMRETWSTPPLTVKLRSPETSEVRTGLWLPGRDWPSSRLTWSMVITDGPDGKAVAMASPRIWDVTPLNASSVGSSPT